MLPMSASYSSCPSTSVPTGLPPTNPFNDQIAQVSADAPSQQFPAEFGVPPSHTSSPSNYQLMQTPAHSVTSPSHAVAQGDPTDLTHLAHDLAHRGSEGNSHENSQHNQNQSTMAPQHDDGMSQNDVDVIASL